MDDAELETKINRAIDVLRINEPTGGYGLAFSGGKDSCVIKQLAIESGVKFKAFYSVTTFTPNEIDIIARYMRQDFDGNGALERTILKKCNTILKGGSVE